VYDNQKSEQSYLSITAACRDTRLITVRYRSTVDKRKKVNYSIECTSKLIYIRDINVRVST
jgi:hypothetical protein